MPVSLSATELKSALYRMLIAGGFDVGSADDLSRAGAYGAGLGLPVCAELLQAVSCKRPEVKLQNNRLIWQGTADLSAVISSVDMLQAGLATSVSARDVAAPYMAAMISLILAPELDIKIINAHQRLFVYEKQLYEFHEDTSQGFTMSLGGKPIKSATHVTSSQICLEREIWDEILALAAKSYVEATAASRRSGAGAGLTDND